MTPIAERTKDDVLEALEQTNRRLRSVVKKLEEPANADLQGDEIKLELKRAKRRLRENKGLLAKQSG